jgi:hypothetical protein
MTDRSKVLLLCPATIAGLTALIYAANRHRKATALLSDICNNMKENVAETRALHRTLRHQRGAINDIHRYLVPVTKGSSKHAS